MIIYIDFLDHTKKNYSHQQIQLRKQVLSYSYMTNATISFSNHILLRGKENVFINEKLQNCVKSNSFDNLVILSKSINSKERAIPILDKRMCRD